MSKLFQQVNLGRWLVVVIALLTLPCAWYSGGTRDALGILLGAVAPGVAFFLIWAIPFDILMLRLFQSDATPSRQRQLKTLIGLDIFILVLLLLIWGGFFYRLVA